MRASQRPTVPTLPLISRVSLPSPSVPTAALRFDDAERFCVDFGGHLASIRNDDDFAKLDAAVEMSGVGDAVFVGAYEEHIDQHWMWTDGTVMNQQLLTTHAYDPLCSTVNRSHRRHLYSYKSGLTIPLLSLLPLYHPLPRRSWGFDNYGNFSTRPSTAQRSTAARPASSPASPNRNKNDAKLPLVPCSLAPGFLFRVHLLHPTRLTAAFVRRGEQRG